MGFSGTRVGPYPISWSTPMLVPWLMRRGRHLPLHRSTAQTPAVQLLLCMPARPPLGLRASLIGSISLPGYVLCFLISRLSTSMPRSCGKGRKIRSKTSAIRRRLIASCLTDCDTTPFTHCMTFSPLTVVLYTVHPGSCFRLLPLVTVHYPPPSVYQRAHWPTSRLAN